MKISSFLLEDLLNLRNSYRWCSWYGVHLGVGVELKKTRRNLQAPRDSRVNEFLALAFSDVLEACSIYQSLCVAATTLPFLYLYINISFLMYHGRASIRLGRLTGIRLGAKRTYATTSYSTPAPHPSRITDADVHAARTYCATLLQ